MLVYRGTLLKVARAVAIIALIALALEVFVFNINFFTSSGYRTINLDDRIQLQRNDEGAFLLTDVDHTLEFSSLNTEVRNIRIDFNADQPAQNIAVKIQFTDSAHQTYFDTTEYTVGIPDASVSTVVDPSKFINLQTAGYVENLRIEVVAGGRLLPHPLERRFPECPPPLRLQPVALCGRFRAAAFGLRVPSQVGHLPHSHCREPAQVEGGHHLRRGHRAGAYDDVPLLRLEPRGRGHLFLQLRRLERHVAREHLRGGRRQRPAVRHAGPGHGQRPAVSGGGAAPVAQGHGGSLRQGRPRRGPEGDRRALPVRCGLPRRALLRLLRRGAGAAVLPALLSAHRGQFPHGHRRARHGAAVHLGGHGPSRPIRPLPFPLGEPRRVPAASDTARVLLRHHVPREVPDLLLPAHHVRPGVLGVGPVLLDALAARRAQVRLAVRRVAVHGARGWLPSPAARAVTSGLPAVLAHLHHPSAGWPPAGVSWSSPAWRPPTFWWPRASWPTTTRASAR